MSAVDVRGNLGVVEAKIAAATCQAHRQAGCVTLVAVTKTHAAERIRPAIEAGHRVFGENRVQEATSKWPALRREYDGLELHLIGALQTNKAVDAVALFDVIESVDRPRLITSLARAMTRTGRRPQYLIQINTGGEVQKAGCLPDDADSLIADARAAGLDVSGLMCIPPFDEEPVHHFSLLAAIACRNGLAHLSMGMSADYATAIAHGATHVRVGTAIFGSRPAGAA